MKKLLSVILTVLIILSMISVVAFADSEANITLRVETKIAQVGINSEDALIVTVYGTWNNIDGMDLFMEFDDDCLEYVGADNHANVIIALCSNFEAGKMNYSVAFVNESSNGENKLFECRFKSKKSGDTQLIFSANEPVVINGQNEFTVNTEGLDIYAKNEQYYYSVSDGKVTLRGVYFAAIDENRLLEIPAEIDGMPVTAIGNNAVSVDYIESVLIPASVTDIGAYAFVKCDNLKDVYIFADSAEIDSCAIGWVNGSVFNKGITIHAAKGSNAEKYAMEKDMFFHECSEYHITEKYSYGDINNDGNINAADARLVLRTAAKLETMTPAKFLAADITRDYSITAADARIILRVAAQLESIEIYK